MRLVGQHHDVLDAGHLGAEVRQHRQEGQVGEDHLIFGMVDDVAELLGEQPRVQGVADRADAHDAVPGLDMAGGVPGQGCAAVARLYPQGLQRVRQPLRPAVNLGVGRPDDRAFDGAADDLSVAMPVLGVVQDLVDRQRPVLHQAQHRELSSPQPACEPDISF